MSDDPEELYYWLTTQPTISEIGRLNRETLLVWPLSVLNALVEGGVDLDAQAGAVLRQVVIQEKDYIGMRIRVRSKGGVMLTELGVCTHPDGYGDYFAMWRRWCGECLGRDRCPRCTGVA